MIIIKNNGKIFITIAGEMLNFETSLKYFSDGEALEVGKDISAEEYHGYPKLIDGTTVYAIRGSFGYIFVPPNTNLDLFEENLIYSINELEGTMVTPNDRQIDVLKSYHTTRAGYSTNIKVKSSLALTVASSERRVPGRRGEVKNTKRQFIREFDDHRRGRFTWLITTINKFDFTINSDNIEDAISRFALSVFYDGDDICKLDHNKSTSEFSRDLLKGSSNIVDETVTIFKYGNPLLFELSDYWRKCTEVVTLRNISENKVFEADYASIQFKPVTLFESGGVTSTDVCSKCRSILYGDNYALAGNIKNPNTNLCVAICPICLHLSSDDKPIETKYFRVFRVTFPRSTEDMLAVKTISEQRREIYTEVMKKVEHCELAIANRTVKYIMIGDKYMAFNRIDDYLFTKLSTHPDFANRKVCAVNLIE